jgi:hypothetical protein
MQYLSISHTTCAIDLHFSPAPHCQWAPGLFPGNKATVVVKSVTRLHLVPMLIFNRTVLLLTPSTCCQGVARNIFPIYLLMAMTFINVQILLSIISSLLFLSTHHHAKTASYDVFI